MTRHCKGGFMAVNPATATSDKELCVMMPEAVFIFLGLVIVAIVNFLGFRQVVKTLEQTKK